jgi:bifunctional enzyme CysN/CysC/sulfate adenylyltransferase subunit 1
MAVAADGEAREGATSFIEQNLAKELLRFTTAGSVDDGKSTLIGRLLHDSKTVYEDQLAALKKSRVNRSTGPIDFSLLTDGLRAEREQGITIDVAHRYFETPRRKFIIADTPGHEQYTRNMATGASTASLAVILIDATRGLLPQTRRHTYISSLLAIPNVLAAINKMDLVDYEEEVYLRIKQDFLALAAQLGVRHVMAIPISALEGDNVVTRKAQMPWFEGPTFLEHLETVPLHAAAPSDAVRFPVQYVIRPDATFRGFAGQIASGVLRPGDEVLSLPSRQKSHVRAIVTYDGELQEAFDPMSVTVTLEDEIDLSRGDMLVSPHSAPSMTRRFAAMVVWFDEEAFDLRRNYLLKHTSRMGRVKAARIRSRTNVDTLEQEPAATLHMNDIATVEFETASPLFFDLYERNRMTGSFILIDPISNATVAAGMIREDLSAGVLETSPEQEAAVTEAAQEPVTPLERYKRQGHYPGLILVEEKPALAARLERTLFDDHFQVLLVSSDVTTLDMLERTLPLYQSLGLVVIYSCAPLAPEAKRRLSALAPDRFFDLAALDFSTEGPEAMSRVVSLLHWLRGVTD